MNIKKKILLASFFLISLIGALENSYTFFFSGYSDKAHAIRIALQKAFANDVPVKDAPHLPSSSSDYQATYYSTGTFQMLARHPEWNKIQNLDSLYALALCITDMNNHPNSSDSIVHSAIADYWLSIVSKRIEYISSCSIWIKYSNRFRLLLKVLRQANFYPDIRLTQIEKGAYYLWKGRIGYVISKILD